MSDYRLVLVLQGDEVDTDATVWLEIPRHLGNRDVRQKNVLDLPGIRADSGWEWARTGLGLLVPRVTGQDSIQAEYDITTAILEATRA
jgi:hypothetical protein